MNTIYKKVLTAIILLIGLSVQNVLAFDAFVDRNQISSLESFTLTLSKTGSSDSQPDFNPALQDFELISGPSQSSQTTIINGSYSSSVKFSVELRPKRTGSLTIPPIRWGNETSQAIPIEVHQPTATQTRRMNEAIFFETTVNTESMYVQSQLIYTVRLFYADNIGGNFPAQPDLDNAVIKVLEEENRYSSIVNNRRYYVLEKQYAIFPQTSGELVLAPETFTGEMSGRSLFSRARRVSARSTGHRITVKPKPASFPDTPWLPAKSLTLNAEWSSQPPHLVVGVPVNLNLVLQATEVPASLLPPLGITDLKHAKVYMDPPQTDESVSVNGVTASRTETIGIVPTETGELQIPEIRINWWNTQTNRLQTTTLPAATYTIEPGSAISLPPPAPVVTEQAPKPQSQMISGAPRYWLYISGGLAVAWLVTGLLWWQTRRHLNATLANTDERNATSLPSEKELFQTLITAVKNSDHAQTRIAMLCWARSHWPEHRVQSIDDISRLNSALASALKDMDRQLYSPSDQGPWDSKNLVVLLKKIRKSTVGTSAHQDDIVPALYP